MLQARSSSGPALVINNANSCFMSIFISLILTVFLIGPFFSSVLLMSLRSLCCFLTLLIFIRLLFTVVVFVNLLDVYGESSWKLGVCERESAATHAQFVKSLACTLLPATGFFLWTAKFLCSLQMDNVIRRIGMPGDRIPMTMWVCSRHSS
jgi:hypothetical protein